MEGALIAIVIVAAAISRPIESRLWRNGRLSDRTTALLLVGRLPVVVCLFALILGAPLLVLIGVTMMALISAALFYGLTLGLLRDQALEAREPS